ncbi:hypothetical protein A3715_10365 [Oleiphilus sp. HI0009]|nr:hypothetical protein A3715_10365 [Oleiphilus sp. HI0009]
MEDVKRMYNWLNENCTPKEAECFLIGCNVALRAGDLLKLRFDQFNQGQEFIAINEQKTMKFKRIPITPVVRDAVKRLEKYYKSKKFYRSKKFEAVYLFQSTSRRAYNLCQPVGIQWLSECYRKAARKLELGYNVNTHSMRKTWGYHAYENGQDIAYIQAAFNHANQRITLAYIGVTRSAVEQMFRDNTMDLLS